MSDAAKPKTRADVTLDCWDGSYRFKLGINELRTLGELTDEGPLVTLNRLVEQRWRLHDLRETIRLALIGAGTPQADALRLVQQNVDRLPFVDSVPIAQSALFASIYGVPEAEPALPGSEVSSDVG